MFFTTKKYFLKLTCLVVLTLSYSNSYTQCFEIESILVDACGLGSLEGENEMIRFKVGATALNSSNLTANYPTANSFLGICQNASSATATAALNATIIGCGFLQEPLGGILPANANVLFLTSTDVNITANSFANLNDTLYVIFQCAGNTGGHFGNSGSGIKTLSISFSSPVGCNDVVSWQNSNLIGGDGALVNFDPPGASTFTNNGCQAPFSPTSISASNLTPLTICAGDTINLTSSFIGSIQSILWDGGTGSFNTPNNATTTYFSSLSDVSSYFIKINGVTSCGDLIKDSLQVNFNPPNNVIITAPGLNLDTVNICPGTNTTLSAIGTAPFLWNTGATTSAITTAIAGNYFVTSTAIGCPSDTDSVYVNIVPLLNVTLSEPDSINICQGNDTNLHANGATNYIWSTSETTDSITVNTAGTYFVFANSICPSDTDTVIVSIIPILTVSINEPSIINICDGESITLTTTGSGPFLWNDGSTFDSLVATTAGPYNVTSSNSCFSDNDAVTVNINPPIIVAITEPNSTICEGDSIILHANGATAFLWSTGETTDSITVTTAGIYTVTSNETCPSNTVNVQINVTPSVIPIITENDSAILCPNTPLTLNVTGGTNYIWNTLENTNSININAIGEYFVEATNGVCPSGFDTITIVNDIVPSAEIIGDSVFCSGESLNLNAIGTGNFSWSTGAIGENLLIIFGQEIILNAENSCGIISSDTIIIIEEECEIVTTIYIPDAFTPNGNSLNEVFKVKGTNILEFNGKIFNRWGQLIFEWSDINNGWDGTQDGEPVSSGVYVYRIKIKQVNNVYERYTDSILLVR